MTKPDVVPEEIRSPIDYKMIAILVAVAIVIQIIFLSLPEEELGQVIMITSFMSSSSVTIVSFVIAKRYWGTHVFGKAYLFLSLGYLSYFIAEVLYYTYDLVLDVDPYPSIADIFFFGLYPCTLAHLIINIRFFQSKIPNRTKLWVAILPIIILLTYSYTSIIEFEEPNFDFYYGIIFVLGAAIILSFTILGFTIFRKGVLGIAWLLLLVGIFISTVGDVWYYYLEVFGEYNDYHLVNVMWYLSDFLLIYALIKHKKIL